LLDYRFVYDFKPNATSALVLVNPQCFWTQGTTNGFAWANFLANYTPGTYTYVAGTVASPNAVILHPLAGGNNVNVGGSNYWDPDPTSTSGRWTSARLIACGIRLIPVGQELYKAGTCTAGIIPGMTQSAYTTPSIVLPSAA